MKQAPAIGIRYRASPTLVVATCVVAVLALIAAWLVRGPAWMHVLLTVAIVAHAGFAVRSLLRPPLQSLLWRAEGGVELNLRRNGREALGALLGARVLGPLIMLTLRWPPRERASLWLLPDNLDAETRRRLRVRLGNGLDRSLSGNADGG